MGKLEKYLSYKDSGIEWLGEIPEDWEVQKLKFNTKIETGNSISDGQKGNYENIEDESYPYLSTKDINYDFSTIDYSNGLRIPISKKNFKISNSETTLICIEGGSAGKKIAFNTQKICYVNKLASIQSINSRVPKFLYYLVKSYIFKKQFELSMNGLIGGVSISTMKNFELIFPPKDEQTKIASFLDEKTSQIDEVINQKEKLIELLKERKQIFINDAVTKGLDKNIEFKDSGIEWIGKIPTDWEIEKVKYIFKDSSIKNHGKEIPLAATQLYGVVPKDTLDYRTVEANVSDLNTFKLVKENNFVISLRSFEGGIEYSEYKGIISPAYTVMEALQDIAFKYFKYLFKSNIFIQALNIYKTGIREGQNISFVKFKDDFLPLPPKNEQIQIAECIENQISKIDNVIELQQNYISKLKEYKASLIDSVVTGKVMVA